MWKRRGVALLIVVLYWSFSFWHHLQEAFSQQYAKNITRIHTGNARGISLFIAYCDGYSYVFSALSVISPHGKSTWKRIIPVQ
jgi:hypothetical protein